MIIHPYIHTSMTIHPRYKHDTYIHTHDMPFKHASSHLKPHTSSAKHTLEKERERKREGEMGSLPLDSESPISVQNEEMDFPEMGFEESIQTRPKKDVWSKKKKKKGKGQVFLERYVETDDREKVVEQKGVARTKSLTDDDLDELKGCLDLGFGFNYEEIPELCNTLPALELCYSMSQRFLDEQHRVSDASNEGATATETCSSGLTSSPIANWKISSPGDHPEEVKARLKFWAQAVACTVRLCR